LTRAAQPATDVETEPPGLVPDIADELADWLRRGRLAGGCPVRKISLLLSDGRRVVHELPLPKVDQEEAIEQEQLSPMEAAVLEVIGGMRVGTILSTQRIADMAGYTPSGKLREYLRELARSGRLKNATGGFERVC
jgi:hypothetical protein